MSKTILITRAKGDEQEITQELHERGHHVIHEPLTEIILDHTMRAPLYRMLLEDPSAILLSSKHAVQALALLTEIRDIMLLCVGEATANCAYSLGFTRIVTGGGTIDHLIEYLRDGYDEDANFIYISGEHIKSDLPTIIQSLGMNCQRIVAYQAVAAESLSDTLLEQMRRGYIDAVTFFSVRNVEIFYNLLSKHNCLPLISTIDAFTLSEEIAQKAASFTTSFATSFNEQSWRKIYNAHKPTLASLLECIDNVYGTM